MHTILENIFINYQLVTCTKNSGFSKSIFSLFVYFIMNRLRNSGAWRASQERGTAGTGGELRCRPSQGERERGG